MRHRVPVGAPLHEDLLHFIISRLAGDVMRGPSGGHPGIGIRAFLHQEDGKRHLLRLGSGVEGSPA